MASKTAQLGSIPSRFANFIDIGGKNVEKYPFYRQITPILKVCTTFWPSESFGEAHVANLQSQIRPYRLYTSNLKCHTALRGWWAKMEIFAPWNAHLRPCLHLDLDTQLLGDWTPLLDLPDDRLCMLRGFVNTHKRNSGIMVVPKATRHIWREFAENRTPNLREFRGDSEFLEPFCEEVIQDHVSGIVSYKYHCHRATRPKARVVCYHGNPRPWHVPEGYWPRKFWERHSGH